MINELLELLDKHNMTVSELKDLLSSYPVCDVQSCSRSVRWTGWYRVSGTTGLIRKQNVCKDHASLLIGEQNEETTT